jgi:AraC family transcriptional regulator
MPRQKEGAVTDPINAAWHGVPAARAFPLRKSRSGHSIIHEEHQWRRPDILMSNRRADSRLIAARWAGTELREQTAEISGDYHMLSISLKPTEFSIWLGTTSIPHKRVIPGTIQLTPPALPARILYHQPYDVLHLFMKNALLREFFQWSYGKSPVGDVTLRDPSYAHDPVIGQLGIALSSAGELGEAYGELYADSLSLAIIARLFALYAEGPASTAPGNVGGLPDWRLKRVIEFMDSHGDGPVTLADLARIAGLSRMHFAAQFRKATGLRPHEYLLRWRIEKAKIMLTTSSRPIAEVALSTGFNSQSHLSVVFKRLTGLTPFCWRERNRL